MHGQGEHTWILSEDIRRSISLMDVKIHNKRPVDRSVGLQHPNGDSDIVEDTKSRTMNVPGVMTAAGRVAGDAVLQSERPC